ncbi:MAG: DegV family protein [Candidatus Dormibacteria bacterium]
MLRVVTDSTSDLEPDKAAGLGVSVVPLTVRFGDEQFRDQLDLAGPEFYTRLLSSAVNPTTSQPAPAAFAEIYRDLLAAGAEGVVSIHIPPGLSGTLQSATLAAREVDEARVRAVDGGTVSIGLQFLVEAALRDIDAGCDLDEVVRNVESRRERVGLYVLFDTLTYLQRGGRIGRAKAFVGGILQTKPVLSVRGEVAPVANVRTRQQGYNKLLELVGAEGDLEAVGVMSTDDPAQGEAVAARLAPLYPGLKIVQGGIGPVVGTYAGPGAVGVGYLRRG